jgi:hypothetical protein
MTQRGLLEFAPMGTLLQTLPAGPLDVIGDVHGELSALQDLLLHLGYDSQGLHPDGRHMVFVGDLVDRGPDSLGVVRLVSELVSAGAASCIVGNHELNLLLGKRRAGNEWFYGETQELRDNGHAIEQVLADDDTRVEIILFLLRLPLALERADLRVVHACWDPAAIEALRGAQCGLVELFYDTDLDITKACMDAGHEDNSMAANLARQNGNPVTVLTSGRERPTDTPFRAGGQTRHVERVPWWQDYQDDSDVIFGHYWRAIDPENRAVKRGPYLFGEHTYQQALGPKHNAYCVDYSVGYRNVARAKGDATERSTALAAMRYPEHELMLDDGTRVPVIKP